MMLEDVSSESLSSVDFGRAAEEGRAQPHGLGLPPPTECIETPVDVLDVEAAVLDAEREKSTVSWQVFLLLRRMQSAGQRRLDAMAGGVRAASQAAKPHVVRMIRALGRVWSRAHRALERAIEQRRAPRDTPEKLPPVKLSDAFDLEPVPDTAKTPVPLPKKSAKPRVRYSSQKDVITQVVDMRPRRTSSIAREKQRRQRQPVTGRSIQVSDLVLPVEEPPQQP